MNGNYILIEQAEATAFPWLSTGDSIDHHGDVEEMEPAALKLLAEIIESEFYKGGPIRATCIPGEPGYETKVIYGHGPLYDRRLAEYRAEERENNEERACSRQTTFRRA